MKKRIASVLCTVVVATIFTSFGVYANALPKLSWAERSEKSDVVLIAKVTSITHDKCLDVATCARLKVLVVLKGVYKPGHMLLFDVPISEHNPKCCIIGKTYLMFLKNVRGHYYLSVNGRYGIYALSIGAK